MPDKNTGCRTGIYSIDRKTQKYAETTTRIFLNKSYFFLVIILQSY
jgi:hypothetical protein